MPLRSILPGSFLLCLVALLLGGCRDSPSDAGELFQIGVLYAVTDDSSCKPARIANCDRGSLFLRLRDSLYSYNAWDGLLSVHPYELVADTLFIDDTRRALTVAGTTDELRLREQNRAVTYQLEPLARQPSQADFRSRMSRETLQLDGRGDLSTIHPLSTCGDDALNSHAIVETGTPDTVQFVSWRGVYQPVMCDYHLFQVEGKGVYLLEESGADRGRFRMVDHYGNLQRGLYNWHPDYYAPVEEDLRGRWQGHRVFRYDELVDEDNRRVVPKWGLTQKNNDNPARPLEGLHPDSTYRFDLIIDEQYTVYLEMNDRVIASFPSLYSSVAETGLLHAENNSCETFSFQRGANGQLTTNLTLGFQPSDDIQSVFPVRMWFDRMAR
ncbi:MAG: hypothetical protein WA952_10280 [Lewinella sp.]